MPRTLTDARETYRAGYFSRKITLSAGTAVEFYASEYGPAIRLSWYNGHVNAALELTPEDVLELTALGSDLSKWLAQREMVRTGVKPR